VDFATRSSPRMSSAAGTLITSKSHHCPGGQACGGEILYATRGPADRRETFRFGRKVGSKADWAGINLAKELEAVEEEAGASAVTTSGWGTIVGRLVSYTTFSGHL
jgi:hypothetical protein